MRRIILAVVLPIGVIASMLADTAPPPSAASSWPALARLDAASSSSPAAPTGLAVVAVQGSSVTLRWDAPATGPEPTAYLLEGGLQPGEVLGQVPVGPVPETTLDLPAGVLYLRLYSVAGSARSIGSNELRVVVGSTEVPSAPSHLLGLVQGDQLTLSWRNTFTGGAPSRLWLEVSGALSGVLPMDLVESSRYAGVPPGTYTLRLFAANDAGLSEPSPAVTLNVPAACSGAPGPVTHLRSWRSGSTLTIDWDAPAAGAPAASYRVQVSGTLEARLDTTSRRVSGAVPPGHYSVQVTASNACGQSPAEPPAVDWTAVVRSGSSHLVHFSPVPGASGHRVFWSTDREAVIALTPDVHAVDVTSSPAVLPEPAPGAPVYYRVFSANGPVVGGGGPPSLAPTFETTRYVGWPAHIAPGLFDVNGDGCPRPHRRLGPLRRLVQRYPVDAAGLHAVMLEASSKARDARFADFQRRRHRRRLHQRLHARR